MTVLQTTHPYRLIVDQDKRTERVRWLCGMSVVPPKLAQTLQELAMLGDLQEQQIVAQITIKALAARMQVKPRTMKARVQRLVELDLDWLEVDGHNWGMRFVLHLSDRHAAVHTAVHADGHTAVHTDDVAQDVLPAPAVAGDTEPELLPIGNSGGGGGARACEPARTCEEATATTTPSPQNSDRSSSRARMSPEDSPEGRFERWILRKLAAAGYSPHESAAVAIRLAVFAEFGMDKAQTSRYVASKLGGLVARGVSESVAIRALCEDCAEWRERSARRQGGHHV